MTLLDASMLSRLERLQLATRRPLAGSLAGEHRSPRRGVSLDFADYREYTPGDDYRRLDYHMLARLDVLLIKLFEADDELTVRLLLDTSASMATDGKLEQAQRLAAAIGFVALTRRDIVTLQTFPGDAPPRRYNSRGAAPRLFTDLETTTPSGLTALGSTIRRHLSTGGPAGMTVLISDLLTPDWEVGITRPIARGGALTVAHVLARRDLDPDLHGDLDLIDRETTTPLPVSLNLDTVAAYSTAAHDWADAVASRCRQVGAAYVRVFTDDDLDQALFTSWRNEGVFR